jgi:hypothetical protein
MSPSLNVGRNCFRFFQVQAAFREAHSALARAVAASTPPAARLEALAEAVRQVDSVHAAEAGGGGGGGALPPHAAQLVGRYAPLPLGGGSEPTGSEREFPLLGCIIANLRDR